MKKFISLLIISIFAGLVFWSCGSDDNSTEPDSTTLTCKITSPLDSTGFYAGDTVRVTVDANDEDASIIEVRFQLDGIGFWSDETYPYTAKISTDTLAVGGHIIAAIAENDKGKEIETKINFGIRPENPSYLSVEQINVYSFRLSWAYSWDDETEEVTDVVDGFKIERKIDDGNFAQIAIAKDIFFVDSTLINKSYNTVYYQVRAYKEIYNSDYVTNYATIGFPAPSNFTYTKENLVNIRLNWNDNSTGEDGFKIDKKIGVNEWVIGFVTVAENIKTWTDSNAEINEILQYRLYAYKGTNTSSSTLKTVDNAIPSPTNFTYTKVNLSTIRMNWNDNSTGEDGFKIDKKIGVNDWIIGFAVVGENINIWTDSDAEINESLQYRLYAYKESNTSETSKVYIENTFQEPSNLAVDQTSVTSATLSWDDNSTGEDKFEIERKQGIETNYSKIGEIIGSDTATKSFNDAYLEYNKIYDYRVRGVKDTYSSDYVTKTGYESLPSPSELSASKASATSIKLNWIDNSIGEHGFKIDRKVDVSGTWEIDFSTVPENTSTWIDSGLSSNIKYFYRIRAFYSDFYTNYTNEAFATPFTSIFIEIPTGTFLMGSNSGDSQEQPVHTVNITMEFYLSKYETTQQEWIEIIGSNPSYFTGDLARPVETVSWGEIIIFCNKRSIAEGLPPCYSINGITDPDYWDDWLDVWYLVVCDFNNKGYRLPTEAEWEYAARHIDGRTYPWGDSAPSSSLCNYNTIVGTTTVVGSYPTGNSNLGLSDMAGNVWESCWDWWGDYSSDTQTDPTGPITPGSGDDDHIARGGGWSGEDPRCTVRSIGPKNRLVGFRLAKTK